ncbi:uncharacterized protein LOC142339767 [Convolutriloba macropyga]|uniref:uncharacterized protein LOC142339767 n=1 Tax=Convolutriloba macropyga TaxID=536237 RepID=UPI003F51D143
MAELPALTRSRNIEYFPSFGNNLDIPKIYIPKTPDNDIPINRLPNISNVSQSKPNPQQSREKLQENKWMKRREETKADFFQNLDVIHPKSSSDSRTSSSDQPMEPIGNAETFFVPLTPKRSLEPKTRGISKLGQKSGNVEESSPLREVTNLREEFLANKKREFRNSKGGSVYFVPLSPRTGEEQNLPDYVRKMNQSGSSESDQSERLKSTQEKLKLLGKVETCFFCGKSMNMCNMDFHNEARCKKIVREKTFTIRKSNRTSWENPLGKTTHLGSPWQNAPIDRIHTSHQLSSSDSTPHHSPFHIPNRPNTNTEAFRLQNPTNPVLFGTADKHSELCSYCSKPVTRWTVNYHSSKLCQQNELAREKTMMILRNPEMNFGERSTNDSDPLNMWCPEGLRNSQELESLKNLMQPPILKHGKDCQHCGKWFGTKSLPIHMANCRKKPFVTSFY